MSAFFLHMLHKYTWCTNQRIHSMFVQQGLFCCNSLFLWQWQPWRQQQWWQWWRQWKWWRRWWSWAAGYVCPARPLLPRQQRERCSGRADLRKGSCYTSPPCILLLTLQLLEKCSSHTSCHGGWENLSGQDGWFRLGEHDKRCKEYFWQWHLWRESQAGCPESQVEIFFQL